MLWNTVYMYVFITAVVNALQVNDTSLENVTHNEAVAALKSTGERVRLLIAKTAKEVADDKVSKHDTSYVSAGKYH